MLALVNSEDYSTFHREAVEEWLCGSRGIGLMLLEMCEDDAELLQATVVGGQEDPFDVLAANFWDLKIPKVDPG